MVVIFCPVWVRDIVSERDQTQKARSEREEKGIFIIRAGQGTMGSQGNAPLSFSKVPGNPSFRKAAVNAVALVPLLSSKDDGAERPSKSAASFAELLESLRHHSTAAPQIIAEDELLLVVPNSSLTRPGDWRYNETPLKAFHWQHGSQRLMLFDGRPQESRPAHDRLINQSVTRDWIDLCPSRRTAAVVGVLNLHDCESIADLHRAEEELHEVRIILNAFVHPYVLSLLLPCSSMFLTCV